MGIDERNTGIRKACPTCKKLAFKGLKFKGEFSEEVLKCPHCGANLFREISVKLIVKLTALVIVLCFCITGAVTQAKKNGRVNCSSFKSYEDAQFFYKSDPQKYGYLDSNKDGEACQSLKAKH